MKKIFIAVVFLFNLGNINAQCTKDTDCRGDRICVEGTCVNSPGYGQEPLRPPADEYIRVDRRVNIGFYAGLAFPFGEFRSGNIDKKEWSSTPEEKNTDVLDGTNVCLGTGFGALMDIKIIKYLYATGTVLAVVNLTDGDEITKYYKGLGVDPKIRTETSSWINVAIMPGLKVQIPVHSLIELYGVGHLGLNLSIPPDVTVIFDNPVDSTQTLREHTFDFPAATFGFGLGTGVIIDKIYNIGLKIFFLGRPEFKTSRYTDTSYSPNFTTNLNDNG